MKIRNKTYRQHILEGTGIVGSLDTSDWLNRSRFFIDTMEKFIETSETEEVKHFEKLAGSLSDQEKDEFWQWNYPIHWQDIFGVRIRSAFCIQLCSQVESTLGDIAHRIQFIKSCPPIGKKKKFKQGSMLERHKRYFNEYAQFVGPVEEIWEKMGFVFRIRNAHIHFQGFDVKMDDDDSNKFRQFLSSQSDIGVEHNFTELKEGSCGPLIKIAECFYKDIVKEYENYRIKILSSVE